ncbi:C_GCAxxG_C_C family protein [Coriobacteriales bacterium OH1046]|nr:C_GCAxxG_C_C family protein [Coriobacteriales bacterium OH1046]
MAERMTEALANQMMDQGYHCSQCVLMHAAEVLGRDKDDALRISSGLGGGLFHGEVCGTVSAAAVAISMAYGFHEPNPGERDDLLKAKIHEFEDRFLERYGTMCCRELLGGYDCTRGDDGQPEGVPENPWEHCGEYCAFACTVLDEILACGAIP